MKRLLIAVLLFLPGCVYYRIHDPVGNKDYLTSNWNLSQSGYTGSIAFTDIRTGQYVVLQSFEAQRLTEQQMNEMAGQ